jgi:uncharacterized protein (TIRG00374 family)
MKLKTLITLLISAAFLLLAVWNFEPDQFVEAFRHLNPLWVIPALGAYMLSFAFRTVRWHIMLRSIKPIRLRSLFAYIVLGYMANNTLPARLGELVRAYVTGKRENMSRSSVFASVLLERMLDGLTIVLILLGLLLFADGVDSELVRAIAAGGSALFVGGLAFLFALAYKPEPVLRMADNISGLLPERLHALAMHILQRFVGGLKLLHTPKDALLAFVASFAVWGAEVMVYWIYIKGFGFEVPFTAALLCLVVVNLAMLIPSSPAGIGVFQYAVQRSLVLFAVGKTAAVAFSFAVHFTQIIPIIILGLILMARMGLSMREIRTVHFSEDSDDALDPQPK